jgi:hypothetical protein
MGHLHVPWLLRSVCHLKLIFKTHIIAKKTNLMRCIIFIAFETINRATFAKQLILLVSTKMRFDACKCIIFIAFET